MITKGLEAIGAKGQTNVATVAKEAQQGGGVVERVFGMIEKAVTGQQAAGAIPSDPYRMEMVKTLDRIQLMYAKKFAADTAKAFGVPEVVDHIVVSP